MHDHEKLKDRICEEINDIIAEQAKAELLNRDKLEVLEMLYEVKHYLLQDLHHTATGLK